MKISFPYMGQVTVYRKMLEALGHEVVMPHRPTQRTFDLGVLYSPEFICYPFKVMMGTYVEACEQGAEVIVSSGGSGPCRAGLYGEVHRRVLKQLGYDTELIIFDSLFENFGYFWKQLTRIKNKTSVWKILRYVRLCLKMAKMLDRHEKKIKILRAYEVHKGDFDTCLEQINDLYYQCDSVRDLKRTYQKADAMLERIPIRWVPEEERVRIGIVGEIYVIMESATNMNIERRLNDLGIEVFNVQYISDWLHHNLIPKRFNKSEGWKAWDRGFEYKCCNCGGHDMENTGWIIKLAEQGYDGVIHLMPFGCLPVLVTRSIIPEMSEELDVPILSMSIDEQNGEANTQTRLEAFVDLCRSRHKARCDAPVQAAKARETAGVH